MVHYYVVIYHIDSKIKKVFLAFFEKYVRVLLLKEPLINQDFVHRKIFILGIYNQHLALLFFPGIE
jgi:hypothetical protein